MSDEQPGSVAYQRYYLVETPGKGDERFKTLRADSVSVTDGCLVLVLDKIAVAGFAPGSWRTFRIGFAPSTEAKAA